MQPLSAIRQTLRTWMGNLRDIASQSNGPIVYGRAAAIVGLALVWFAIWTATSNVVVLGGFHYPILPWGLLTTTGLSALIGWRFVGTVVHVYAAEADIVVAHPVIPLGSLLPLLLALGTAVLAAVWTHRTTSPLPYIGGTAFVAVLIWWMAQRETSTRVMSRFPEIGWRLPALFMLLVVLYYFSHRPDGDDSSY